jgi:hypothetical protein
VGLAPLEPFDLAAYRAHRSQQNRLRSAWIVFIAGLFYPGFLLLDRLVYPDQLRAFVAVRLIVTAAILSFAGTAWRRPATRYADLVVMVGCSLAQLGVLIMIHLGGGFASGYWAGLLLVDAAFAGLTPHGAGVAALFFAVVQGAYLGVCALGGTGPGPSSAAMVEPMFFLGAGGAILAIVAGFSEVSRQQVFQAKLRIAQQDMEIGRARAQRAEAIERSKAGRLNGKTLGRRYQLIDVLGRGGAGEVYLADDLVERRRCAVKVLHPDLAENHAAIARFLAESENALAVANEHVVKMLGKGYDEACGHFLVMEHVEGEDLGALLQRRGSLPFDELVPIVDQIGAVLDDTHAAGVIHRDLKPKNVLIATRGGAPFVKLIDFGISKMLGREVPAAATAQVAIFGTVGYMAPEQAFGLSRNVDAAADIFSLAAIVYRALTGQVPFSGESLSRFCLTESPEPFPPVEAVRPNLHPDLTLALALGMARDPRNRVGGARVLVTLLEKAARGELAPAVRQKASGLYRPTGDPNDTMSS